MENISAFSALYLSAPSAENIFLTTEEMEVLYRENRGFFLHRLFATELVRQRLSTGRTRKIYLRSLRCIYLHHLWEIFFLTTEEMEVLHRENRE